MSEAGVVDCRAGTLRFSHPGDWTAEVQGTEEGVVAYLQSEDVTFGVVGAYPGDREPSEVVEQVLEDLRSEHPGLETEDLAERGWGEEGAAAEAVFLSLDTVAYCWIRSWPVGEATAMVFVQTVEREAKEAKAVFRAICRSVEDDEE